MQDTMTIEGIVIAVLGAMSMMEGNPSGISLQGMGSKGAQFHSQMLLETVRYEREKTDYYKNFLKHSVVQLSFGGLTIVIGGILTLLCGILLF